MEILFLRARGEESKAARGNASRLGLRYPNVAGGLEFVAVGYRSSCEGEGETGEGA